MLMWADPLRGQVGGVWALETSIFWAPNGTRLKGRCHFTGPKPLPLALVMDLHASKTLRSQTNADPCGSGSWSDFKVTKG